MSVKTHILRSPRGALCKPFCFWPHRGSICSSHSAAYWLLRLQRTFDRTLTRCLIGSASDKCPNQDVKRWLRENSESEDFCRLPAIFHYLQERIAAEEKKDHDSCVDIVLLAHGAIKDFLLPASRLLPLSSVNDVVLYSPWNCITRIETVYGVATGLIRPQHRIFTTRKGGRVRDGQVKVPNHWNSMKAAGDQLIPNVVLSSHGVDGLWNSFENLTHKYGGPPRNRIIIPFIPPPGSDSWNQIPLFVVTLALALALLSSRFYATIHLATCLGDQSTGRPFDKDYLTNQYACTEDNIVMTSSLESMMTSPSNTTSWFNTVRRFFTA